MRRPAWIAATKARSSSRTIGWRETKSRAREWSPRTEDSAAARNSAKYGRGSSLVIAPVQFHVDRRPFSRGGELAPGFTARLLVLRQHDGPLRAALSGEVHAITARRRISDHR